MALKQVLQSLFYRATKHRIVDTRRYLIVEKDGLESPVPFSINCARRSSFEEAKQECGAGYLNPAILAGASQTIPSPINEITLQSHMAALFASLAVAKENTKRLRVLDFGGALGAHYTLVRSAFRENIDLDWYVVETDLYVDYAAERGFSCPPIFKTIEDAAEKSGGFDFALFSGVLQYLDDWRKPLNNSAVTNAEHIMISRTPMGKTEIPFVQTVDNPGHHSKWAGRVMRRGDIADAMPSHRVSLTWDMDNHLGEMGVNSAPSVLWKRYQISSAQTL